MHRQHVMQLGDGCALTTDVWRLRSGSKRLHLQATLNTGAALTARARHRARRRKGLAVVLSVTVRSGFGLRPSKTWDSISRLRDDTEEVLGLEER